VQTLNRPEARNAWTEVMRNEIIEVVDDSQRDPGVRVIVITGSGEGRAFCAGMDLSGMPGGGVMPGDSHPHRVGHSAFARDGGGQASLAVARSLKPVICAINGAAVGIGATFPCACDMRIAAADQKFGFVFGQRGLTMEGCSSFFLPRLVGMTKANDFVLTARIFECGTEADCGLFTEVVPSAEEVLPKAMEIAKHMALNVSPMCAPLSCCRCGCSGSGCGSGSGCCCCCCCCRRCSGCAAPAPAPAPAPVLTLWRFVSGA